MLSDTTNKSDLSSNIQILSEINQSYTIEQIKSGSLDSLFSENKIDESNDYHCSVWSRIKIVSVLDNRTHWILQLPKYYSDVSCFAVYPNGKTTIQKSGWLIPLKKRSIENSSIIFDLPINDRETVTIYLHIHADLKLTNFSKVETEIYPLSDWQIEERNKWIIQGFYAGLCLLCIIFWLINFFHSRRSNYLYMILSTLGVCIYMLDLNGVTTTLFWSSHPWNYLTIVGQTMIWLPFAFLSVVLLGIKILQLKIYFPKLVAVFFILGACTAFSTIIFSQFISWKLNAIISGFLMISWFVFVTILAIACWKKGARGATSSLAATSPFFIGFTINAFYGYAWRPGNQTLQYTVQTGCAVFTIFILFSMANYLNILRIKRAKEQKEKEQLVINQNIMLEQKVDERTRELKETQNQMVQQEKLASLGQMTSGIAHEIQNPLNFVTNFSSLSKELLAELIDLKTEEGRKEIFYLLDENLTKIEHHGKRADNIVKGMLMHSRTGLIEKQLSDINELCENALNLAYHSIKAKIAGFDCKIDKVFADNLPPIMIIPQDISRVILNLLNNAFYAVRERNYLPNVILTTEKNNYSIIISVIDNGYGVPEDIKDKIFQPFFTSKPAGEGTGLGLSVSYDIVRAHGGEINIFNHNGSVFKVILPIKLKLTPENTFHLQS